MAATRSFRDLVRRRVATDPAFADELRHAASDAILRGDADAGASVLRDYFPRTVESVMLTGQSALAHAAPRRMDEDDATAGNGRMIGKRERRAVARDAGK